MKQRKYKGTQNLTKLFRNGSNGNANCQKRKMKQKLLIQERVQRTYSDVTPFTFEPFRFKRMNLIIAVCQGLHSIDKLLELYQKHPVMFALRETKKKISLINQFKNIGTHRK